MFDFLNVFFILLKYMARILLLLPLVMYLLGLKTNSKFLKELAWKLILFGITLSIILTLLDYTFYNL